MKNVKLMIGTVAFLAFSQGAMADVGKMDKDSVRPGQLACATKETKSDDTIQVARLTKPGYSQDSGGERDSVSAQ